MTVEVRRSTAGDAEALTALLVEMHAHYGRPDPKLVWVRVHKAYFPDGKTTAYGPFVAVVDGVVVGFALSYSAGGYIGRPPYSTIEEFFVTARARGRGVGRALFDAVTALAAERGSRHIVLGNSLPRDLTPAELGLLLDDEVYAEPSLLPRGPDLGKQERSRQLRELAEQYGWEPPVMIDRRREIFDFSVGDVLGEGDVPFAILHDDRVVRVQFRTTWQATYFGDEEHTTWRLTLDGRTIHGSGLEIDSRWARDVKIPQRAQPHPDGGEGVQYEFHLGHHLATVRGTIEYIFHPSSMRVELVKDLEIDTSP